MWNSRFETVCIVNLPFCVACSENIMQTKKVKGYRGIFQNKVSRSDVIMFGFRANSRTHLYVSTHPNDALFRVCACV